MVGVARFGLKGGCNKKGYVFCCGGDAYLWLCGTLLLSCMAQGHQPTNVHVFTPAGGLYRWQKGQCAQLGYCLHPHEFSADLTTDACFVLPAGQCAAFCNAVAMNFTTSLTVVPSRDAVTLTVHLVAACLRQQTAGAACCVRCLNEPG